MDTHSLIQFWLVSCWLTSIVFVLLLTIFGGLFVATDKQVMQVATDLRRTQRQFDLFITTMAGQSDGKPFDLDPHLLAELRAAWLLIEREAKLRGMTTEEFMRQVASKLSERDSDGQ